ncbi:MAG: ATP-binding protein [Desulfomicrobium sp.]|jgi:serine/threonine-protein kinase RsbW|nr:ATP-binding protein [Desulfomicrobium sp.]NLV96441.1 ATP-binding protein [Desulfovibrionales bacterium]
MFQVTQDTCSFSVTMTTELTNVDKCIEQLKQFLKTTNQQHTFFHVALLAREALNNAMVHGNRFQSEKKVFFHVCGEEDTIILQIEDQGPGFDWKKHLDFKSRVEAESGRGQEIFRLLARKITYNDCGNILTLEYEG